MVTDNITFLIAVVLPWLVTASFLVIITIVIIMLPKILKTFLKFPKKIIIFFILILAIGALVRFFLVPNIHRINFDEDRYLSYAVTFARFGIETNVVVATPQKLVSGDPDGAARITVPTVNAWLLKFFGYSEDVLFKGAKIFSLFQIVLVFILAMLITRSYFISLFAMFGVAFLPPTVFWSVSTTLDPYFVNFSLLFLTGALWYAKSINLKSSLFLAFSAVLLLLVRIEGIFIIPTALAFITLYRKNNKLPILTKKDTYATVALILILGFRVFISLSIFGKPWCCGEGTPLETFMPGYLIRNTIPNLSSLFIKPEVPFILTILALIALIKNDKWYTKVLSLWFFTFFFLYSSYYAGKLFSYEFSGSYGRFFLMLVPPFLMLAALTLEEFWQRLKKANSKDKRIMIIVSILCLITLIPTISNYKTMVSSSPYENIVEKDTRIFHKHTEEILIAKSEKNAVINHTLTGLILLNNKTSVYIGSFINDSTTQDFVFDKIKKGIPVYMVKTNLCENNQLDCIKKFKNIRQVNVFPESVKEYGAPVVKLELINQEP